MSTENELEFSIDGILRKNLDFVKDKVLRKKMDFVICIDGRVGQGKSTFGTQIARYLDPTFNLDRIVFTPNQFIEALKIAKKGEAVVFDEAMLISSRSAMSEFNRAIVTMMAQIRSKQLFIFFILPSIFDLDRNLSLHRVNLLLHCYSKELGQRGRFTAFFEENVKTLYLLGKKFYSYGKPKANFYGSFSKYFSVDMEKYEKKKQDAINSLTIKANTRMSNRFKIQRDNLIRYLFEKGGLKYPEIATLSELSKGEVGAICRKER